MPSPHPIRGYCFFRPILPEKRKIIVRKGIAWQYVVKQVEFYSNMCYSDSIVKKK